MARRQPKWKCFLPTLVADGAEPVGAAVAELPTRFADPDLARPAESAPVHDPAELGPAPAALPRWINSAGPGK